MSPQPRQPGLDRYRVLRQPRRQHRVVRMVSEQPRNVQEPLGLPHPHRVQHLPQGFRQLHAQHILGDELVHPDVAATLDHVHVPRLVHRAIEDRAVPPRRRVDVPEQLVEVDALRSQERRRVQDQPRVGAQQRVRPAEAALGLDRHADGDRATPALRHHHGARARQDLHREPAGNRRDLSPMPGGEILADESFDELPRGLVVQRHDRLDLPAQVPRVEPRRDQHVARRPRRRQPLGNRLDIQHVVVDQERGTRPKRRERLDALVRQRQVRRVVQSQQILANPREHDRRPRRRHVDEERARRVAIPVAPRELARQLRLARARGAGEHHHRFAVHVVQPLAQGCQETVAPDERQVQPRRDVAGRRRPPRVRRAPPIRRRQHERRRIRAIPHEEPRNVGDIVAARRGTAGRREPTAGPAIVQPLDLHLRRVERHLHVCTGAESGVQAFGERDRRRVLDRPPHPDDKVDIGQQQFGAFGKPARVQDDQPHVDAERHDEVPHVH